MVPTWCRQQQNHVFPLVNIYIFIWRMFPVIPKMCSHLMSGVFPPRPHNYWRAFMLPITCSLEKTNLHKHSVILPIILEFDRPEETIGDNGQTTVYINLHKYMLLAKLTHWTSHSVSRGFVRYSKGFFCFLNFLADTSGNNPMSHMVWRINIFFL